MTRSPLTLLVILAVLVSLPALATEPTKVLFDFADPAALRGWRVQDDVVMGGLSKGNITRDPAGYAVFSGKVSLENNGGFSSIQNNFDPIEVSPYEQAVIRLKGDGKDYRFIVKAENDARHYYVAEFPTTGHWEEIKIPLRTMYPVRRGDRLDLPDYPGEFLSQVRFIIANRRAESFQLEIAGIALE